MPLSLIRGLLIFTFFTLAMSGCLERVEDWCETNSDCQGLIEKGIVTAADVQCHPHDHLCYPGCKTTADCAAYPGTICHEGDCWKQNRWQDVGVPDKSKDMGADQTQDVEPDGGHDTLPPDTLPPDTLKHSQAGESCANGELCVDDRTCVDGVCCKVSGCHACQKCKPADGANDPLAGTCVANTDLKGENPKDACGTGICAGSCLDGKCAYPVKTCERTCDANILKVKKCATDKAACDGALPDQDCKANICSDKVDTCPTFCTEHGQCVTGVCDRTEAQADGEGRCVPADEILGPDPVDSTSLETLVGQATAQKTTIRLKATPYQNPLTISKGEVRLIAPQAGAQLAGLTVDAGAKVFVQGVSIGSLFSGPVLCQGKVDNRANLTIVESTIPKAPVGFPGLLASQCDLTLRRSKVHDNKGGGLDLSKGTFVLTNNLIVKNGTASADLGGVLFSNPTSVTFINNTLADNASKTAGGWDVVCPFGSNITLTNSILASTGGGTPYALCEPGNANVDNTCGVADPTYKPTVGACFDQAAPTTVTGLVWDFDRTPRVKGGSVDLGAYEIK